MFRNGFVAGPGRSFGVRSLVGLLFRGIMKPIPVFILLIALIFASSIPAKAQIFSGPNSTRQAQKAAKKQQKAQDKAAKKQQKSMKKYEKAQQKASKSAQRHT
jgi:uncharacterized membrane protein (DUF106 family)